MPDMLVLATAGSSHVIRRFEKVARYLASRLPDAVIEHVGSTAISGCVTKGDLDVLVRVAREDFPRSVESLDGLLARSPRNVPTDDYVEYDCGGGSSRVSVQLVVVDSWHDHRFHGLKELLICDSSALERYNALKREYEGRSMDEYRTAKGLLIDALLSEGGC